MAAAATKHGKSGIFWTNSESDEEEPLAFIPGVDKAVSRKPVSKTITIKKSTKMQNRGSTLTKSGKKACYLNNDQCSYLNKKTSHFASAPAVTDNSLSSGSIPSIPQVLSEISRAQSQVGLKDLCPEDKRRIANLIEELARVSEEKDESVQRLKDEHDHFERKIQQLEQQNLVIAHERENLQQQYRECQELLGLYQQYLSQQQMKLNQSIAELSQAQAHYKVLSNQEAPSRTTSQANGPLFDGSYLGLAATSAQQPQVHRRNSGRTRALQTVSIPTPISFDDEVCPPDEQINQHRIQTRECELRPNQGTFQDSGYGTQQRRTNGHSLDSSCQNTFIQRHHGENSLAAEAKEALTSPLLGREDWEEKRHQLLLQKMHLEMEQEKLQARLADQEERLRRQNEQLCQSRLDSKRFQEACQSKLSSSTANEATQQPDSPRNQNLPSSVRGTEDRPAQQCLQDRGSQTAPLDKILHSCEVSVQSKRDTATSPVGLPASPVKLTTAPVTQKTPENRLDFSLVELLDIFSPASACEQCKPSARKAKTLQRGPILTTPKSVCRSLRTPVAPYPLSHQQDLEESQILEDIFFIC
uniref:protein hinderin n=1 Tax=Doryrhamphus excisus TaxID=161450 RepID=UPI0025ADD17E|nr:protein hinderin [Doryrhamphus excisus]